jgi:hypothetical protein
MTLTNTPLRTVNEYCTCTILLFFLDRPSVGDIFFPAHCDWWNAKFESITRSLNDIDHDDGQLFRFFRSSTVRLSIQFNLLSHLTVMVNIY